MFSPDNNMIVSVGNDNKVRIWDKEGKLVHELVGHRMPVTTCEFSINNQ